MLHIINIDFYLLRGHIQFVLTFDLIWLSEVGVARCKPDIHLFIHLISIFLFMYPHTLFS